MRVSMELLSELSEVGDEKAKATALQWEHLEDIVFVNQTSGASYDVSVCAWFDPMKNSFFVSTYRPGFSSPWKRSSGGSCCAF